MNSKMKSRSATPEQNASPQSMEQARRVLGNQALFCVTCGCEQPLAKGYVKVPVKVREQSEIRPSRVRIVEPITIRDSPIRKRADEANFAEKKARLDADHSFYRAIARRHIESH